GLVELRNGLVPLLRERGLAALVEAAVEAGGYDLAVLAHTDGAQRYANLRRLVRLAQRVEELHGPNMAALRTSVEALMARGGRDPGEAVLVDPELDAVRLASIHAVKGQQFPVVILADTHHRLRADTPDVRVADDGRVGFRLLRTRAKAVAAFAHRRLGEEAAERTEREERRLLYVALTRAMRHVVIVGPAAPDSGTQQALLLAAAEEINGDVPAVRIDERETLPIEAPEHRASPEAPPLRPAPLPAVVPAEQVDPLAGRELSFTALATAQTCLRRFRLEVEEGLSASTRSLSDAGFGDDAQGREGARVGVLVHRLLAAHRWGGPPPSAGWAATMASDAGLRLTPAAHERAERLVFNALRGPLTHRLAAGDPRSEVSFALTCAEVTFTGAFDLVVREPDGGLLRVDWKPNRLGDDGPERAMAPYRLQQVLYGLAALRTGAPSVELHWVFLERPDAPVVWRVGRGDSPLLEDELRAALAPLRRSERPPITERVGPWCRGCPGLDAFCPAGDHLRAHGE
ncbi:MAG TPA: PD-(D/E)XK nuclease family protein, partial [Miltoncostaeaceae bacterium]|nr:PD-(D/E)XK nuclease family protein [Miltoncostaeaceae bacterium]